MKHITALLVILLSTNAHADDRYKQLSKAKTMIEIVHTQATRCNSEMKVRGYDGTKQKDCVKFIKLFESERFTKARNTCKNMATNYKPTDSKKLAATIFDSCSSRKAKDINEAADKYVTLLQIGP